MLVRSGAQADHRWRVALLTEHFGSALVVGHGVVYDAAALPGLVCIDSAGHRAGALSYRIADGQLEVVSIDAKTHRQGTGTKRCSDRATGVARSEGCRRAWLVTTNDNLDALRFDQRRGWRLVRIGRGAVDSARVLKPLIPKIGAYGIEYATRSSSNTPSPRSRDQRKCSAAASVARPGPLATRPAPAARVRSVAAVEPSQELLTGVARLTGARPVGWVFRAGGFTPAERWSLDLVDGRRVFAKRATQDWLADALRAEYRTLAPGRCRLSLRGCWVGGRGTSAVGVGGSAGGALAAAVAAR